MMQHADRPRDPSTDVDAEQQRVEAAQLYVRQLQAFHVHAGVFAGSMIILVVVNLLTNLAAGIAGDLSGWWSAWALLGWGIGIAVHGLVVRLNRPAGSGPSWEQQQIDKVLER